MISIIKVSLADLIGDQSFWRYDSKESDITLENQAKSKRLSSMVSDTYNIQSGIIYNFDERDDTLKISFQSSNVINGYSGYAITVIYNEGEDGSIFADRRAVQYADCMPSWIEGGITKRHLEEELPQPQKWLKAFEVEKIGALSKEEKVMVAWIVNALLDAKKSKQRAKCGIVVGENMPLEQGQKLLKVALGLLPVKLSNRCSYNFNSNIIVEGLDLFCTSADRDLIRDASVLNVYYEDGKLRFDDKYNETLNNDYAEFLKEAGDDIYEKILDGYTQDKHTEDVAELWKAIYENCKSDDSKIVEHLNKLVPGPLLERKAKQKIDPKQNPLEVKELYQTCESLNLKPASFVDIEFTAVAYSVFFADNFYDVPQGNAEYFKKEFLLKNRNVSYEDITKCANKFELNKWQPLEILAAVDDKKGLEYLKWLWRRIQNEELFEPVANRAKDFLFSVNNIDNTNVKKTFERFFDYLIDENQFENNYLSGYLNSGRELFCKGSFTLTYLESKYAHIDDRLRLYERMQGKISKFFDDFISRRYLNDNNATDMLSLIWNIIYDKNENKFIDNVKEKLPENSAREWTKFFTSNRDNESAAIKEAIISIIKDLSDDNFAGYLCCCDKPFDSSFITEYIDRKYLYSGVKAKIDFYEYLNKQKTLDKSSFNEWLKRFITVTDFKNVSDFGNCTGNEEIKQHFCHIFKSFLSDNYKDDFNAFKTDVLTIEDVAQKIGYDLKTDDVYCSNKEGLQKKEEEEKRKIMEQAKKVAYKNAVAGINNHITEYEKLFAESSSSEECSKSRVRATRKILEERKPEFEDKLKGKIGLFEVCSILIIVIVILTTDVLLNYVIFPSLKEIGVWSSIIEYQHIISVAILGLSCIISIVPYLIQSIKVIIRTKGGNSRKLATTEATTKMSQMVFVWILLYFTALSILIGIFVFLSTSLLI